MTAPLRPDNGGFMDSLRQLFGGRSVKQGPGQDAGYRPITPAGQQSLDRTVADYDAGMSAGQPTINNATMTPPPSAPKDSIIDAARKQLADRGITDTQRAAAYLPRGSEVLYHNVTPMAYGGHLNEMRRAYTDYMAGKTYDLTNPTRNQKIGAAREDAWRLYLGLPQGNDTFGVSSFRPGNDKSGAAYLKLNNQWKQLLEQGYNRAMDTDQVQSRDGSMTTLGRPVNHGATPAQTIKMLIGDIQKSPNGRLLAMGSPENDMGTFQYSLGHDDIGPYIAYYDKWDLDFNAIANKVPGGQRILEAATKVGKPYEVYDRLYYNPQTYEPIEPAAIENMAPKRRAVFSRAGSR